MANSQASVQTTGSHAVVIARVYNNKLLLPQIPVIYFSSASLYLTSTIASFESPFSSLVHMRTNNLAAKHNYYSRLLN